MTDFTCDCGKSYNESTGDIDERVCNDCLIENEKDEAQHENTVHDNRVY